MFVIFLGDPYKEGCSLSTLKCQTSSDCDVNQKCVEPGVCACAPPFRQEENECKLICDERDGTVVLLGHIFILNSSYLNLE